MAKKHAPRVEKFNLAHVSQGVWLEGPGNSKIRTLKIYSNWKKYPRKENFLLNGTTPKTDLWNESLEDRELICKILFKKKVLSVDFLQIHYTPDQLLLTMKKVNWTEQNDD